jgi:hypothetical protein
MSRLTSIRIAAAKYFNGKQPYSYRYREVKNLSEIKSIGILFDATDREIYEYVVNLSKRFKEDLKKVEALGFINSKLERDMLQSKLGFDFFNLKSLDLFFNSKDGVVLNFIEKKFDLLIDLNVEHLYPLQIISLKSMAPFKVGIENPGNKHLDMVFKIPSKPDEIENMGIREQNLSQIQELVQNIKFYLKNI